LGTFDVTDITQVVEIKGELLGICNTHPSSGRGSAEIVRVSSKQRPSGPADNALIMVYTLTGGLKRARYISWIGYYDIEEAQAQEPNVWELIEPARPYRCLAEWVPFGRPDMQVLPNH
jgi:hypothetical protein